MEEEFRLEAYHKFLIRESDKDRDTLADLIFKDCVNDQNEIAFELLALTGDEKYTEETFSKAADILLKADQR